MKTASSAPADFDLSLARSDVLGPDPRDGGTNFTLFSENAERVELCLFDAAGKEELHRVDLPEMQGGVWYGFLPGVGPGQTYGYRVHGAYAPEEGHRFNPNKLLLDPYARELTGDVAWDHALFGYRIGEGDLTYDERNSAPFMPKGVVVDNDADGDGICDNDEVNCIGDLNEDGLRGAADILILLAGFGCSSDCGIADLNDDGLVAASDILMALSTFGLACPN